MRGHAVVIGNKLMGDVPIYSSIHNYLLINIMYCKYLKYSYRHKHTAPFTLTLDVD